VATVVTLVITFVVSFIPFKFEFTKAIRQEFLGFDIYDLYYSGNHIKNTTRDTSIVLVEVGDDRAAIAGQISIIRKYSPAVLGVDVTFKQPGDTIPDALLVQALTRPDSIVFASEYTNTTKDIYVFKGNFFDEKDSRHQSGYINFLGTEFSVVRNYPPFIEQDGTAYPAFSSAIIKKFSPEKYDELKKRHRETEIIDYRGNLETYTTISKQQLPYLDKSGQLKSLFEGKIVLLGYFVKKGEPLVLDDLHFSPLNEQVAGKSFPDIYGVAIHANILSMILSGSYASQASELFAYLMAAIIVFFFLWYLLSKYKKSPHPNHGWFLLLQFIIIVIMLYVFLQVFNLLHIKVPLLPIMVGLVLSVELLGVYKWIALWLNRKYNYTTVFNNNKHGI
jgi:CHASE2 domain-containing sensor protein